MATQVNLHEAKTHLSRLVEQAAKGQEIVIAKAGRPMVRLVPVRTRSTRRALGFLSGRGIADADIKAAFAADIEAMFGAPR